jgi:hypothetical protein
MAQKSAANKLGPPRNRHISEGYLSVMGAAPGTGYSSTFLMQTMVQAALFSFLNLLEVYHEQ